MAPPSKSPLRARALTVHARILASRGRYELTPSRWRPSPSPSRLDLNELASDAITTLSGLKKAGPKEGLRAALVEAVERAERTGAVMGELRGRFLLGRSFEDWGEFAAPRTGSAGDRHGDGGGRPWAPYGFESRWRLAWVRSSGPLGRGAGPHRGHRPEPAPDPAGDPRRRPAARGAGREAATCPGRRASSRRLWEREGGIAIHAAASCRSIAGRAPRVTPRRPCWWRTRTRSAYSSRIWHEWFSARIRLAAVTIAALAPLMPTDERRRAGADRGRRRTGCTPTATRSLLRYSARPATGVRRSAPGISRLDAERLRGRWLAGVDAPTQEALLEAWRQAAADVEEFGHVHELARVRAGLAGILRATGDPAAARELADQAAYGGPRAGCRSRSWRSSARWAPRRSAPLNRQPPP